MSLQTKSPLPSFEANASWLADKKASVNFGSRFVASSVHKQILKASVSIVLLVGVVALVGSFYNISDIVDDFRALSLPALGAIFVALFANAFAAAFRFKVIANEIKHPVTFHRAVAAVSAGSLGGALFFQIAGQLMARGVVAGKAGMPFAAVVVITAYERCTAAIVSALFALGAPSLFLAMSISINPREGPN